jgi:hypothetical protein
MILTPPVLVQVIELLHRLYRILLLMSIEMAIIVVLKVRVPLTAPITPIARVVLLPALRLTIVARGILTDVVSRRVGWVERGDGITLLKGVSMMMVVVTVDLFHGS